MEAAEKERVLAHVLEARALMAEVQAVSPDVTKLVEHGKHTRTHMYMHK